MLGSDKFEGRAPGTAGEDTTVAHLESQFKSLGLQPGNPDGTYVQKVPLVGITGANSQPLVFTREARGARREGEGRPKTVIGRT